MSGLIICFCLLRYISQESGVKWMIQEFQKPEELEMIFFYDGVSVGPSKLLYLYLDSGPAQ